MQVIATKDSMHKKMESVIQQLLARSASLIIVCTEGDDVMLQYESNGCRLIQVCTQTKTHTHAHTQISGLGTEQRGFCGAHVPTLCARASCAFTFAGYVPCARKGSICVRVCVCVCVCQRTGA